MSDQELIAQILNGSSDAFGDLFDKYYTKALRTAYLITGNKCDSEYVVQDTFISCYENLSKLKNREQFKAWFFKILTRTAWRYCSKQKREQPVADVFDNAMPSPGKSSFQILAEQETSSEIKNAIETLSTKQKTVIVLYYYNDFSVNEIAKIMHCTVGTVKSRLFCARKNLSKTLSPMNERSFENAYK